MADLSNPSVSIVIPCHNAERWIAQAIESALAQMLVSAEVIVVDDASTDDSTDKITAFGDRVRFIRGEWRNGNAARNAGLAAATGEWVQFLDADDLLLSQKIAAQLAGASKDADMLYSPLIVREERANGTFSETLSRPSPGADLMTQWLRWELCQTGAALWRTDALRRIGGWKDGQPCCQDNELTLRAIQAGLKIEFVDAPGAVYRVWSDDTVCRRAPVRVIREKTKLLDAALDWLAANGKHTPAHTAAAGQACFEMARTWAKIDLSSATAYAAERHRRGCFRPRGPAAPASYRAALALLGFNRTERLARWTR